MKWSSLSYHPRPSPRRPSAMSPNPPEYTLLPTISSDGAAQLDLEEDDPHHHLDSDLVRFRRVRSVYAGLLVLAVMLYGMYLLASGPWECGKKGEGDHGAGRGPRSAVLRRMFELEYAGNRTGKSPCMILGGVQTVGPSVSPSPPRKRDVGLMRTFDRLPQVLHPSHLWCTINPFQYHHADASVEDWTLRLRTHQLGLSIHIL